MFILPKSSLNASPLLQIAVLFCAAITNPGFAPDRQAAADELDLNQAILRSIAELDSPSFEVREQAVGRLKGFGFAAIQPVSKAAELGSLEVSVRAVEVLETIYSTAGEWLVEPSSSSPTTVEIRDVPEDGRPPVEPTTDEATEIPFSTLLREFGQEPRPAIETTDAAEAALEQLRSSRNRSVAGRAAAALERHYDVREKRAMAEIQLLGGGIHYMATPQRRGIPAAQMNQAQTNYFVRVDRNWTGGDEGLERIKRLSKLRTLYVVDGADVSSEAIEDLQAALPDLVVQYRGEAFLGIQGHPNQVGGFGCIIDRVEENAAADRAGIRPGDMILSFGGKRVTDFVSLIEIIRTHRAGDKVVVQIRRGGRVEEVEVVLDHWSPDTTRGSVPKPNRAP